MIVIGLAGYLLPIPSLIWAWVRWAKLSPRFASPKWRTILAFCDLILVSAIGFSVLLVVFHANSVPEGNAKYAFAAASSRIYFWASASTFFHSWEKARVCAPVALASFGIAARWVIGLLTY